MKKSKILEHLEGNDTDLFTVNAIDGWEKDTPRINVLYSKRIDNYNSTFDKRPGKDECLKFLRSIIAQFIIEDHNYNWIGDEKGYWVKYMEGKYHSGVSLALDKIVRLYFAALDFEITIQMLKEIKAEIRERRQCYIDDFDGEDCIKHINFKNGLLNLETWELEPHTSDPKRMIQIPHLYNSKANCANFTDFLNMIFSELEDPLQAKIDLAQITGYCLTLDISMRKAFIITCVQGKTGKSSFLNILINLLGTDNVSKIRFDRIANPNDRFAKSGMAHKLLNYYSDLPKKAVKDTGILKDSITDSEFVYEEKFGASNLKQYNIIKQIYACNGLPYVSPEALDDAFCGRWKIFDFNHVIENPIGGWEYKNVINDKEEMEGIIAWAIIGLQFLYDEGCFHSATAEEIRDRWRMETDIIYQFVKKACCKEDDSDYWMKQSDLYQYFLYFQQLEGNTSNIAQNTFTKGLNQLGYTVKQKRVGVWSAQKEEEIVKHVKVYSGISIDPDNHEMSAFDNLLADQKKEYFTKKKKKGLEKFQ